MRAILLGSGVLVVLAIASRYPPIAAALPAGLAPVVAGLVGAVLLVVGVIERKAPRGTHQTAGTLLLVAIAVVPNLLPSKKDD